MIYNIRKINNDTIRHELIHRNNKLSIIGTETGISKIENLEQHLQDWANQRRETLKITSVTNDFGYNLK